MEVIGRCIGESSLNKVTFVANKLPRIGDYVVLEYEGLAVLGMIENVIRGSVVINNEIISVEEVEKINEIEKDSHYIKGTIKIIGDIRTLKIPRIPPPPGTEVKIASKEILSSIFGNENGIKIGHLVNNEDVEVYLDVNKLVSRHLAILSITGAGKSNTVAVILDGLLKFHGTSLVFDMHSEYVNLKFKNGETNIIPTKINPLKLSLKEIAILANIEKNAYIQFRYFKEAWLEIVSKVRKGEIELDREKFKNALLKLLEDFVQKEKSDKKTIYRVIGKMEEFFEKFKHIIDFKASDFVELIKPGFVNVIDLGSVDEDTADVIVSHCLKKILEERKKYRINKKGLRVPIFVVLEEAHILAPRDRETLSLYWISRIAREGRKFGIGLCLVSQRPKSISSDALSQANNMIILKLVEPNDQKYVQQASELLSDELLAHLPSLNVGEAVVIGPCVKIPAIVKIDLFEGKIVGRDPNVIKEWKEYVEEEKEIEKDLEIFM